MIEYQKSMANNALPKTDRLYLRILEKEKQDIAKEERQLYLGHFKASYGIKADQLFQNMVYGSKDKEIEINESCTDSEYNHSGV